MKTAVAPHARSPRTLVVAISVAAVAGLTYASSREQIPLPQSIALAAGLVAPCVVLGRIVWRFNSGERRPPPAAARAFLEHAVVGASFSAMWIVSFVALAYVIRPDVATNFLEDPGIWQFVYGFVIYGAIAFAARGSRTELQLRKREAQLREREFAATCAELQALRAQLDPHFLFNTLHSLTQLAREDPYATGEALERFGELMRYVLNAGHDAMAEVPLEDDIGFVRHYLALESLRLGERLHVVEELDPDALELAVPPLLLQPLVENAIRHAVAPRIAGGTIRLSAKVTEDTLTIEVADDGAGADPEAWRCSEGLGLQIVRRQIESRFPGADNFRVITRPGGGFTVRLQIPACIPDSTLA
jgi:signal transduction histidine kinase